MPGHPGVGWVLPRQRGTLGLWDKQGTHPSATSIRGMFWNASPKSKQQGWGDTRSLGGERGGGSQDALSHRAVPTPPCPEATVMGAPHPAHRGSPTLWGWSRGQVAAASPYTPESGHTTIPPAGFTAATRA